MRELKQTENFTIFGGFYPPEKHRDHPMLQKHRDGSIGPLVAVLVALVLGATTTAGAITAAKSVRASNYGFSIASYSKIPGVAHFEDALY